MMDLFLLIGEVTRSTDLIVPRRSLAVAEIWERSDFFDLLLSTEGEF